jgi:hypothetical protein
MATNPTLIDANGIQVRTADQNASISIGPTGLVITEGLVTPPLITGQIGYNGFTTTNPNGIQFNSNLNMNANTILASDPVTGSNISIDNDEILMVDGSDPQVTQCSIRGSRIAFQQTQFPNRTLTIDPDNTQFVNGGFQTNISGGVATVSSGSTTCSLTTGGFLYNDYSTGGLPNPALTLTNYNIAQGATQGFPVIELHKRGNLATTGDVLGSQIWYGRDPFTNLKTEFARIQTAVENSTPSGNIDGSLQIYAAVNGTSQQVFTFNGGQNENNSFRPLDLNGNNLRTSSGSLTIDTTLSSGPGIINLNALQSVNINAGGGSNLSLNTTSGGDIVLSPSATGEIIFTGAALQSGTSSGNSGQHLVIRLNGVQYKIALQNP